MKVTGTFHSNVMLRQITEAVMINKVQKSELINSKRSGIIPASQGPLSQYKEWTFLKSSYVNDYMKQLLCRTM